MTEQEVSKYMSDYMVREQRCKEKVIEFSRQIVNILKDSGNPTTASELERLLFIVDSEREQLQEFIKANSEIFFDVLIKKLGG